MDPYEYFPGDPPVADMLATLGLCVAAIAILVSLILLVVFRCRPARGTGRPRSRALAALAGSVLLGLVSATPIVSRQFGAWGRLRARLLELRSEFDQYRTDHSDLGERLLIDRFREERGEPWPFRFTEQHHPVQITLTHATPVPEFRVNFGRGGNADFDPDTMWVLYSD